MNPSDPNVTFAHTDPIDDWYERMYRHVSGFHAGKRRTKIYLHGPCGIPGLSFNYGVGQFDCFAELFIKPTTHASSKSVFDNLHTHRDVVGKAFGSVLAWDRMEGKEACRIRYTIQKGYQSPREEWPEIQAALIDAMHLLEKALHPFLRELG